VTLAVNVTGLPNSDGLAEDVNVTVSDWPGGVVDVVVVVGALVVVVVVDVVVVVVVSGGALTCWSSWVLLGSKVSLPA
jgi:hypothetical protein